MSKFPNDKKHLPFGHSAAIADEKCLELLANYQPNFKQIMSAETIADEFCEKYACWLSNSTNHTVIGFDDFKFKTYSHGTTEAFDKFYIRNKDRRFRCFKTEYMYHQLAWRNVWDQWKFIEDDDLKEGDAVLISIPFADTGDKHHLHDQVLEQCNKLGIPVLVDCCYFSISTGLTIDLSHSCITDVTFSLSKAFPVAHARIGMRMTRVDDDDTLFVYQKSTYNNRLGAALGLEFINNFSCDYIPNTYREKQKEFCELLGVAPSKTVLFGIAQSNWHEYNRGGTINRLSLHKHLTNNIEALKGVINGSSIKQ
jgi:hypothetical protein